MTKVREGWSAVPFWSLYRRVKRVRFPDEELLSVYRDYGVIRKADRDDNWNRPGEDMSAYQLVERGDLVLNKMKTWQGSLGVSPYRGIVSPAYFVYTALTDNDSRFLHYALRSSHYIEKYVQISKGVRPNQWDLQPGKLDAMLVFLPPHDEQGCIADYLDRETAEIDAMDAELDRLVATLRERRAQAVEIAMSGDYQRAPLWAVTDDVIDCPHTTPDEDPDGPAEAVRTASVRGGRYLAGNGIVVSARTAAERNGAFPPQPGDVFFSREAPAGEACVVPAGRVCLGQRMVLIRPNRAKLDAGFLVYAIYTRSVQDGFVHSAGGSTVVNLKLGTIRSTRIPWPALDEQRRIAAELDEQSAQIDEMIVDASRLKTLLAERRSTLITEAITGVKEVPA